MNPFKRKKNPLAPPIPVEPPAPVVWHPVLKATMNGRNFSFDATNGSIGKVHVSQYDGYCSQHMWFVNASELWLFGKDCIEFAERCDGLRSFTEAEVKGKP